MAEGMAGSRGCLCRPEGRIMNGSRKNKLRYRQRRGRGARGAGRRGAAGGGPMSSAVRETAEKRGRGHRSPRRGSASSNAADARAWRTASAIEQGRVIYRIPRGRAIAHHRSAARPYRSGGREARADEMDELKASIRVAWPEGTHRTLPRRGRGQLQLKKGWRRLTALRALL